MPDLKERPVDPHGLGLQAPSSRRPRSAEAAQRAALEPDEIITPRVPPPTQAGSRSLALIAVGLLIMVMAAGYFALGFPGLTAPEQARAPDAPPPVTAGQAPTGR